MRVSQGMHELAGFEPGHLRDHQGEQRVRRDVERFTAIRPTASGESHFLVPPICSAILPPRLVVRTPAHRALLRKFVQGRSGDSGDLGHSALGDTNVAQLPDLRSSETCATTSVANLAGHDEVRQGHSLARVGQHDGERDALAREAVGRRLAARVKPLVVAGEGFEDAHPLTLLTASLCPTSFRHTVSKRMGLSTWMRSMIHRMAGFQWTASRIPRAAEGVMTSYETRSALNSGRVKHAYSPHTWSFTPQVRERRFRRAGAQRAPARGGEALRRSGFVGWRRVPWMCAARAGDTGAGWPLNSASTASGPGERSPRDRALVPMPAGAGEDVFFAIAGMNPMNMRERARHARWLFRHERDALARRVLWGRERKLSYRGVDDERPPHGGPVSPWPRRVRRVPPAAACG